MYWVIFQFSFLLKIAMKNFEFLCGQLRYYDSEEDTNCKGFIELFDVQSVQPIRNVQGAPKKSDENAFFEVIMKCTYIHLIEIWMLGFKKLHCIFYDALLSFLFSY